MSPSSFPEASFIKEEPGRLVYGGLSTAPGEERRRMGRVYLVVKHARKVYCCPEGHDF